MNATHERDAFEFDLASDARVTEVPGAGYPAMTLASEGRITPAQAVVPVLAAITTNTFTKMFFALSSGGRTFSLYVIPGLLLMAAAAWAGAWFTGPLVP